MNSQYPFHCSSSRHYYIGEFKGVSIYDLKISILTRHRLSVCILALENTSLQMRCTQDCMCTHYAATCVKRTKVGRIRVCVCMCTRRYVLKHAWSRYLTTPAPGMIVIHLSGRRSRCIKHR